MHWHYTILQPEKDFMYIDIGSADEFPPGSRKIISIGKREIGVFNTNGKLFGLQNRCPHQGAPLCRGVIEGTVHPSKPQEYEWDSDQELIRCPWHGWEFNMVTGKSLFDPELSVKVYRVSRKNGKLYLDIEGRAAE